MNNKIMIAQEIPVTIYSEMTPNPNTMKFVANKMLVNEDIVAEYRNASEAKGSSVVAESLFAFPFVKGIFIARNFITVSKVENIEWDDITLELRLFISDLLKKNPIVISTVPEPIEKEETEKKEAKLSYETVITSDFDQTIVDLLEEYVRPAVENDGGAIHFKSFENGIVTVILKGSCSGCPSSTQTLKGGVEQLLRSHLQEVKEVVAESH
ncbi:MAG: Fe-S cluster biogenesis protein NfuA [Urechidicola sp.]|jgi:Fe-S cluster biogenesis protein NfuA|tara:strand:- start:5094 stop:5726 length:633 start_codon:yes stop_codon:yes gene_type:complete